MLNRQSIAAMHRLIAPHIRRTPVIDIHLDGLQRPVTLKLECLQVTGSFKARGAYANMVGLEPPPAGVTAASGGNHGIAVARAAATLGVKARIFVPEISSPAKVARIRQEGAEVTIVGARYADSLAASEAYAAESGALPIHAYNAEATLLGQGTIAAELEAQASDLDTIMVAVGGGGLIGGIAAWYSGAHQILGIEPSGCNTLAAALEAGGPGLVETGVRRRFARRIAAWRSVLCHHGPDRCPLRAGRGPRYQIGPDVAVGQSPASHRAGRCNGARPPAVRPLPAASPRTDRGGDLRRECGSGNICASGWQIVSGE